MFLTKGSFFPPPVVKGEPKLEKRHSSSLFPYLERPGREKCVLWRLNRPPLEKEGGVRERKVSFGKKNVYKIPLGGGKEGREAKGWGNKILPGKGIDRKGRKKTRVLKGQDSRNRRKDSEKRPQGGRLTKKGDHQ